MGSYGYNTGNYADYYNKYYGNYYANSGYGYSQPQASSVLGNNTSMSMANSSIGAAPELWTSNAGAAENVSETYNKAMEESTESRGGGGDFFSGFFEGLKNGFENLLKALTDPKTLLLMAGMIALCIMFPPLGTALMYIGGGMAALQVLQGVSSGNGEQAGEGAFNLGLAVIGGKSTQSASKASQSAAISAADKADDAARLAASGGDDVANAANVADDTAKLSWWERAKNAVGLGKKKPPTSTPQGTTAPTTSSTSSNAMSHVDDIDDIVRIKDPGERLTAAKTRSSELQVQLKATKDPSARVQLRQQKALVDAQIRKAQADLNRARPSSTINETTPLLPRGNRSHSGYGSLDDVSSSRPTSRVDETTPLLPRGNRSHSGYGSLDDVSSSRPTSRVDETTPLLPRGNRSHTGYGSLDDARPTSSSTGGNRSTTAKKPTTSAHNTTSGTSSNSLSSADDALGASDDVAKNQPPGRTEIDKLDWRHPKKAVDTTKTNLKNAQARRESAQARVDELSSTRPHSAELRTAKADLAKADDAVKLQQEAVASAEARAKYLKDFGMWDRFKSAGWRYTAGGVANTNTISPIFGGIMGGNGEGGGLFG